MLIELVRLNVNNAFLNNMTCQLFEWQEGQPAIKYLVSEFISSSCLRRC